MALKPCYLSQVLLEEEGDQQVIFITERDGARRISILIGPLEALAIDRAIKGMKFPRPLTHDLFVHLLDATGWLCREIRIVDMKDRTFFAEMVFVDEPGKEIIIDCRPSDAIAIMVRLPEVPLLVAEEVLAEAGA
ncbi:MAG TPA: bifunctional nuclease family protein [Planctomycetota bacterium]|nr:bifunctional nuclease family protein [Planctomycetota bacterium]